MASKVIELEYNGKAIPISIGYYALKRFKQERNYDFEEAPEENALDDLEVLFWFAMEAGFKHKQREASDYPDNPYNREDDLDLLLDSLLPEFTAAIPSFFRLPETPTPTGIVSGQKKPPTGTTRKPKGSTGSNERTQLSPK